MSISRRQFIHTAAALAAASTAPALAARAAEMGGSVADRSLVVIELAGGSDGLNTVIPFTDPAYYAARPTLAIPRDQVLRLTDSVGLHPAMGEFARLFRSGQLAVIQGVGYPDHSRSHFRSSEIFHRGLLEGDADGLLGRYAGAAGRSSVPAVYAGAECPEIFRGLKASALQEPAVPRTPRAAYPDDNALADALAGFSRLIVEDSPARFFHARLAGFDTHARQAPLQARLLGMLSSAVGAFLGDLAAERRERDVLVMIFSEFGRRVRENSSAGTDHGAASVMLFAGGRVKGGVFGRAPSLTTLHDGDLIHTTDFRTCYATVLENYLGTPARQVLAASPARLAFV